MKIFNNYVIQYSILNTILPEYHFNTKDLSHLIFEVIQL